ncbi:sulfur carrier protein ThiS [Rhizobium cremeum]|uniref:sulfur carrier protein ThiS n=1 Tax=Rhizobium cremeum TaxID=2813827 RepID=UPI000DE40CBD
MTLIVNGEQQDCNATTLEDLLRTLDYEGDWLATAVNGELVHREDRASFPLSDSDRIEILTPMQGG